MLLCVCVCVSAVIFSNAAQIIIASAFHHFTTPQLFHLSVTHRHALRFSRLARSDYFYCMKETKHVDREILCSEPGININSFSLRSLS